jgi:glycosyltransferase involved in cell wall biosynthesis
MRVLFVGRYVEKKGLNVLREIATLRPNLEFILAGSGPLRPENWGLKNVRDVGPQPQNVLADLYRWADVLLLPSVGEGFPLVIQEAMTCGLPVICGSPSERADPGAAQWLCGLAIDLADPKGSALRCVRALDGFRPTAADRVAMAQYALHTYDWSKMASRLIELAQPQQLTESP